MGDAWSAADESKTSKALRESAAPGWERPVITAIANSPDGKRIIVLGITSENITRLIAGKPIRVTAETHPGFADDLVIGILFGKDEHALTEMLKPFLSDETKIVTVPRDKGKPQ